MTQDFAPTAQKCAEENKGVVGHQLLYKAFKDHYKIGQDDAELTHYQLMRQDNQDILTLEINGETIQGEGNGTLSALCNALQKQLHQKIDVLDYSEHAMKQGKNAKAIAYIHVQVNHKTAVGIAIASDTVTAMISALMSAVQPT